MIKSTIRTAAVCLSAALLLSGLISCKKSATEKSKVELLTQSSWKIAKEEEKAGTGSWVDYAAIAQPYDKDNIIIFNANGTFENNEGATKQSPSDAQIIGTGTWSLKNNNATLSTTGTGSTSADEQTIDQLDANTLVLSSNETNNGIVYYSRITLSH